MASFAAGAAVAAGSIVSVFGEELAAGMEQVAQLPLPTTLNGSTLRFNGTVAARQGNAPLQPQLGEARTFVAP